ncbi:hypothetical protein SAMN05216344_12121 [Polaromonas sp. OV174]|nr:hypothetical protein SAMN05216344_12121 [Polaromonas sp. OV174]
MWVRHASPSDTDRLARSAPYSTAVTSAESSPIKSASCSPRILKCCWPISKNKRRFLWPTLFKLSSYQAIKLSSYQAIKLSSYQAIKLSSYQAIKLSSFFRAADFAAPRSVVDRPLSSHRHDAGHEHERWEGFGHEAGRHEIWLTGSPTHGIWSPGSGHCPSAATACRFNRSMYFPADHFEADSSQPERGDLYMMTTQRGLFVRSESRAIGYA